MKAHAAERDPACHDGADRNFAPEGWQRAVGVGLREFGKAEGDVGAWPLPVVVVEGAPR